MTDRPPYSWAGPVGGFLAAPPTGLIKSIVAHERLAREAEPRASQKNAWRTSLKQLRAALLSIGEPAFGWWLVLEYELPYEGGRRVDAVLLAGGTVVVTEFKGYRHPAPPNLDQVLAYARDLSLYHAGCRDRTVTPVLVLARKVSPPEVVRGVAVTGPLTLADVLGQVAPREGARDPGAWVAAEYAPLPGVVGAARRIFASEPLPQIRQVESSRVPAVQALIDARIAETRTRQSRTLIMVSGVPGAGKTLVGLSAVYAHGDDARSVYLTGNGPLVEVLRYALASRVFVRAIRQFYLQYANRPERVPRENLIVFDEAQRAWDAGRMAEEYGIHQTAAEAVMAVADRAPGWAVVVALLGEGQEIHTGEEEGPTQWVRGVANSPHAWDVVAPPHLARLFGRRKRVTAEPELELATGLRSHRASAVPAWAAAVLDGDSAAARPLAESLWESGYPVWLTRTLSSAKDYVTERYRDEPLKTYGLIASSRARNLVAHGVPNDYLSTRKVAVGPWYLDPPGSPRSGRQLASCVTEFGAQGLELDLPIVCWGTDLTLVGGRFTTATLQKSVRDPLRLRLNSYRVLLTRGRDGVVVFVPESPELNAVAGLLARSGARLLLGG